MTTSPTDTAKRLSDEDVELVKRLREVSRDKRSEAWRRTDGGQDLSIGAILADEAADAIERLSAPPSQWKVSDAMVDTALRAYHYGTDDGRTHVWSNDDLSDMRQALEASQALTEPTQVTSVDGVAKELRLIENDLRREADNLSPSGFVHPAPFMRIIADRIAALPLPVSADGSGRRDAVIEECARRLYKLRDEYEGTSNNWSAFNFAAQKIVALKSTKHKGDGE